MMDYEEYNRYVHDYEDNGQPIPSTKIGYDNTDSGLNSVTVQGAIDEVAQILGEKQDKTYDGTESGIEATTVTGAIDELAQDMSNLTDIVEALDIEKQDTAYDNTTSGLSATTIVGAIDELAHNKVDWESNNILGAHNLNNTSYKNFTSAENYGVEWVVNSDGTLLANGTATQTSANPYWNDTTSGFVAPFSAQVILNGVNSGNPSIHIYPIDSTDNARPYTDSSKTARLSSNDNVYNGNDISFYMEKGHTYTINCRLFSGATASNILFKPMIRLASDTDDTYQPYAMTNQKLTDKLNTTTEISKVTITDSMLKLEDCTIDPSSCVLNVGNISLIHLVLQLPSTLEGGWTPLITLPNTPKYSLATFARISTNRIGDVGSLIRDATIHATQTDARVYLNTSDAGKYCVLDNIIYFHD